MKPKFFIPLLALAVLGLIPVHAWAQPPTCVIFTVTGTVTASGGGPAPASLGSGKGVLAPAKLRITVVDIYLGPGGAQSPSGIHDVDVTLNVGMTAGNTADAVKAALMANLDASYTIEICPGGHRVKICNAQPFTLTHSYLGVVAGQVHGEFAANVCPVPMMGDPLVVVMAGLLLGIAAVRLRRWPAGVEVLALRD